MRLGYLVLRTRALSLESRAKSGQGAQRTGKGSYTSRMALASLLLATVLVAQPPVKLSHSYVKDQKVTYALSLNIADQGLEISGDLTFTTKDDKGNHEAKSPGVAIKKDGAEVSKSELTVDKLPLDSKGLAPNYEFNDTGIAIIIANICGYLPDKEIAEGGSFDVNEKKENYTIQGNGKLLSIEEKDGKKLAKIELKLDVAPTSENPGHLVVESVFDVATGQLVSSKGTVDIDNGKVDIKIERK